MGLAKKLLKPRVIAWAATTVVLVGVLVAANIIASQKYSSLIDNVLGGQRPVLSKEKLNIEFEQDFESKREAFNNGNKVTKEICIIGKKRATFQPHLDKRKILEILYLKNKNLILPSSA